MLNTCFRSLTMIALFLSASFAMAAQYSLDAKQSSLYFVSIKNENVTETHHFTSLSGSIDAEGKAQVSVQLASVETHIPIRNERMQSMFFDVVKMPTAVISAHISKALLKQLNSGAVIDQALPVTIELQGKQATQNSELRIVVLANGDVQVSTKNPLIIDAAAFGLADGVEQLREIAGLKSISTIVPVTATLLFSKDK